MSIRTSLGKLMRYAAIPVGIANPLLGAGLAFAGAGVEKGSKFKVFKEGVVPAGLTFAGGSIAKAMRAVPAANGLQSSFSAGGLASVTEPIAQDAAGNIAGAAPSLLSRAGSYIAKNPDVALKVAGAGLDYAGARQEASTQQLLLQRQIDQEERDRRANLEFGEQLAPTFADLMRRINTRSA